MELISQVHNCYSAASSPILATVLSVGLTSEVYEWHRGSTLRHQLKYLFNGANSVVLLKKEHDSSAVCDLTVLSVIYLQLFSID